MLRYPVSGHYCSFNVASQLAAQLEARLYLFTDPDFRFRCTNGLDTSR